MADVDIYVGGRSQDLKGSAPEIYEDYAVRSASEIFIQDDLHSLLFNRDFIEARDEIFGGRSPEFIDIKVSPRGDVFVRAPGSPDWLDTRFNPDDAHVKAIAAKTQRAYQELQRSRESSPASTRSASPLRERHIVPERSFPYPELRGELDLLRRENLELRHRLQHLEAHSHLDRSDALLRDVSEQLRANQEANRAILEEIGGLRDEVRRGQHDTQQSLSRCLELLARLEEQSHLSPAQLEELEQLRRDNGRLREELGGAREETRVALEARGAFERQLVVAREELERLQPENADLKRALREVEEAISGRRESGETNPAAIRRLIAALDGLQKRVGVQDRELAALRETAQAYAQAMEQQHRALQAVGKTLGRDAPSIEELPRAVATMKDGLEAEIQRVSDAKREVEERERVLLEELERLRPENARLEEELAAIEEAVHSGRVDEESIPDTISRLIRELGEKGHALEEATAAHQAAMKQQQRALTAVGRALGKKITSVEDLPGAVSEALQQAAEREEALSRRTLQAEAELLGEKSLVVDEQKRSEALREELASMHQELEQAREEIKALKGAAQKVAEQHQAEVEGLGREIKEKRRQVKEQKDLVRNLRGQLGNATSDLEAERRKTGAQELEIRRLGERVSLLEDQVEQAGEREKALRAELQSARDTIHDQSSAAEEQQRAFKAKERELHTAQEENRELTTELAQARRALEDAARAHGVASKAQERKIAALSDQVEDLTRKLQAATTTGEELQKQFDAVSAEKRDAEKQVRVLEAQLEEKGGEIDRLARKVERRDATIERQRRDLTKAREDLTDEAIRRSQMERAHSEEVIPLRAKVQELTEGLAEAEERGRAVGSANADLHRQLEEARRELEQARLQHVSDERANLGMAEELERMSAEKDRLKALLGAIDQYEKENAHLAVGTRSLADEIADLDTTSPTYARLPENIRLIVEALKSQIAELKQEQRALDELERTIRVLRADLEVQTEATASEHRKVERLQQTLREHEADFEELKASHREKRSKQSEALKRLRTTLSTEREEARKQLAFKDEDIKELEGEKRELERTVARQAATIRDNEERLADQKRSYDDVDGRNKELQEQIRKLKEHNHHLLQSIQKLEDERDYSKDGEIYWKGKYEEMKRAHSALRTELEKVSTALQYAKQECEALRSENRALYALLRDHLGEGIHFPRDVETAMQHLKARHVHELEQKDLQIAERQERVEELLREVKKAHKATQKMEKQRDSALEDGRRTTEDLLQARRESCQLRDDLSSVSGSRDRLLEELHEAHEQNTSLLRTQERERAEVEDLRSRTQEAIDRLVAQHSEALLKAQSETDEAKRRLSEEQLRHAAAEETGEVMAEIMEGMDQDTLGFTLRDILDPSDLQYVQAYIKAARKGDLGRYKEKVSSKVVSYNAKPYPLSDLSLFTDFFEVTSHLSKMRTSNEFVRLRAINEVLKSLDKRTHGADIARLTQEKQGIIRQLLRTFFREVHAVTTEGSKPLSQYQNIGIALWVWNDILHGLDTSFYKASSPERGFKDAITHGRDNVVHLEKAEMMRQTVARLHTSFHKMLTPFI